MLDWLPLSQQWAASPRGWFTSKPSDVFIASTEEEAVRLLLEHRPDLAGALVRRSIDG